MFRGTRVSSSGGGDIFYLVGVEGDAIGMGVICAYKEKGMDTTIMIGCIHKDVWIDGIGFEVIRDMERNKEVIVGLVYALNELVSK